VINDHDVTPTAMQKVVALRRWLGIRIVALGMRVYGWRVSWRLSGDL
jgi:hypothetical protein